MKLLKMNLAFSVAVLFAAMAFMFTSCDNVALNSDSNVTALDIELTEDDAMAEDIYNSLDAMVDLELAQLDQAGYDPVSVKSTSEDGFICKTVTVDKPDSTFFPKTITIDYGEGCSVVINGDTVTRSGIIEIYITDRWFVAGAERTVTFIDFYINDVQVSGSFSVTNLGLNKDGNMVFEIVVDQGEIAYSDTLVYTRTSHRFREWIRHRDPLQDSLIVTGDCQGINGDGMHYMHEIGEPLVMIRCENNRYQWTVVEGTIEMERDGKMAQLNFGNGTCDHEATLNMDGESREIQVQNRYNHRRKVFGNRKGN